MNQQQQPAHAGFSHGGFLRVTLAVLALAGALGGCTSTPGSARSGDAAGAQQGTSGITVYGTIDMGVTRSR